MAIAHEVEPNGTIATATSIAGTSAVIEGNIFPNADVDYYSFTAAAGDRIYAATMTSFSASASVDSTLDLRNAADVVLETDTDDGSFGTTSSSIAGFTIPSAGTYYLRVIHASATGQLRPYRLFFQQRTGAPTAETETNDTFPGQAMPAGGWASGSTSSTTDVDFYSLNLNAGDTVFASLDLDPERDTTEWNGQLGLGAFGTPPLILVVNDAGAATPDSEAFFMTVKAAGTYGVFVGLPTGGTTFGTYHLSVTVFPAADEGVSCTTYTSTDSGITIPTGPAIVTSTLTVPGNPRIADIDVSLNFTHNFMADLDVELTAPSGNTVGLFSDVGSVTAGAQTTMDTTIDDEAGVPIGQFTVVQGPSFTPELNYRLSWFDGEPAGGTWTLTVRDDAAGDGGTINSWSVRICEPPPPVACPAGFVPTTVFSTDFESGDAGFTHSGAQDEWARGNPSSVPVTGCNSGTSCWKTDLTGGYNASSSQDLLSPNINLTGFSPPVVINWAAKYQIESASFDHASIDARQVGVPANSVRLFEWLGATMTNTVGNPSVTVQEAAGWGQFSARADSLAGLNTELLFHLDSDTTVQLAGLAIDDVSVIACGAAPADLTITKTDGVTSVTPGGSVTYTITASNVGTGGSTGATVADNFPAGLTGCSWTCVGAGGGTCTAAGSGNISDTVNLPAGGSVTYTASCTVSAAVCGSASLANTATVTPPVGVTDPTPADNSATDTDTVTTQADLMITKDDGVATVAPGGSITYTITASNPTGPCPVTGATVTDNFPSPPLTCGAYTCTPGGGATCAGGSGNISDVVNLPVGGTAVYSVTCTVSPSASGSVSNTASIAPPAGVVDPTPGNTSSTDTDPIQGAVGATVTGTKTVAGTFAPGGTITYTIILSNSGPGAQGDNPGNELTDILPASLTLVSATATSGTASTGANTVNWNGAIPAGGSVTITITATISAGADCAPITNQGTILYDSDGNGSNETTTVTDNPAVAGTNNPTTFVLASCVIPTLSPSGLLALVVLLGGLATALLRRRRNA
jgi:uncharacterized repeat protein (TIGR01451 family)